ncbi:YceI family protein [Geofilum sp. OHC36d9]|uniref:YceI family protein n=1 Tax=Geofilum sp. OHC36d9 TaxID=3458413 RepID=UPI004033353F
MAIVNCRLETAKFILRTELINISKKTQVLEIKCSNSNLAKSGRLKSTTTNDHFGKKQNAKVGLLLLAPTILVTTLISPVIEAQVASKNTSQTECSNFVRIEGSSNVNQFYFEQFINDWQTKEISFNQDKDTIILKILASNFVPSIPMMYEDFIHLIKADQHPEIQITIETPPDIWWKQDSLNQINTKITIQLAGTSKKYEIPGTFQICHNHSLHLKGAITLNLTDFDLHPPSKFMGMIKVKDEVFVKFGLVLEDKLIISNFENHYQNSIRN